MRSLRTAMKSSPCSPQLEKACAQQRRPKAAKKQTKKSSIKNSIANIILKGERLNMFPLKSEWGKDVHYDHSYSTQNLKF